MLYPSDLGDPLDIHPGEKHEFGQRLAQAMRALASSDRRAPSGPRATTAHHTPDGSVILDFTDITGALEARGSDHPIGFELRSEEHTSELQSLMRISYAVFCLKKKRTKRTHT